MSPHTRQTESLRSSELAKPTGLSVTRIEWKAACDSLGCQRKVVTWEVYLQSRLCCRVKHQEAFGRLCVRRRARTITLRYTCSHIQHHVWHEIVWGCVRRYQPKKLSMPLVGLITTLLGASFHTRGLPVTHLALKGGTAVSVNAQQGAASLPWSPDHLTGIERWAFGLWQGRGGRAKVKTLTGKRCCLENLCCFSQRHADMQTSCLQGI